MTLLEEFKELSLHPKNAEELKGFILKLAVQGKLSNLASDYQQIPLSELGAWAIGSGFPKSEQGLNNMEILFAKVSDMNLEGNERFINTTNNSISRETASKIRAKIHPKGTVIFPKIGGAIATNKRRIIIQDTCIDNNCLGIIPKENVSYEWLFLVLSSIDFTEYQTGTSLPALSQKIIGEITVSCPSTEEQKAIVEVVNQLFEEVEQLESLTKERIQIKESFVVSALDRLSNAHDVHEEWNFLQQHFSSFFTEKENIKRLRETILQLAVQGKLTAKWRAANPNTEPASELLKRIEAEKQDLLAQKKIKKEKPLPPITEEEKPFELPEGWSSTRLGNIGDWGAGATPLRSKHEYYRGSINWFKSGELNNGIIDYDSEEKITYEALSKTSVRLNQPGDVLIAMYGATIGKTGILNVEGTTNQAVCACRPFSCIASMYLHLTLKGLKQTFLDQGEGGAQPNISRVKIRTQVFSLPPLQEQKAIVERVNSLMAMCDELEGHIENGQTQIEELMKSCLAEVAEA